MVLRRSGLTLGLAALLAGVAAAHGDSPGAPEWEGAVADFSVFAVALALLVGLGWQGLAPLFRSDFPGTRFQRFAVGGLVIVMVTGLGWAVLSGTLGKLIFPPPPDPNYHSHRVERGGQVSMYGDFHVEFSRFQDEYRIWVSDAWRRPIAPQHYRATLAVGPGGAEREMEVGNGDFRFVKAPAPDGPTEASLQLKVPGRTIRLKYPVGGDS